MLWGRETVVIHVSPGETILFDSCHVVHFTRGHFRWSKFPKFRSCIYVMQFILRVGEDFMICIEIFHWFNSKFQFWMSCNKSWKWIWEMAVIRIKVLVLLEKKYEKFEKKCYQFNFHFDHKMWDAKSFSIDFMNQNMKQIWILKVKKLKKTFKKFPHW